MTKSTGGSEAAHLKQFMDFKQSTHTTFVSNSVGMALLHLSKIYFTPDAKELEAEFQKAKADKKAELTSDEKNKIEKKLEQVKLDTEYENCINDLVQIKKACVTKASALDTEINSDMKDDKKSDSEIRQYKEKLKQEKTALIQKAESINHIIKTTHEDIIQDWDQLTLYFPNTDTDSKEKYKATPLVFTLKKVLTLVWKALHDDKKFMQHYNGTADEKLRAAHADQEKRLESFYNTIDRIRVEGICHTGNRNDLVFTLNQTYDCIHCTKESFIE